MLNKMRIRANEKGFTLIELMIVIAIIGILAAIAVPNFIAFRDKGFCSSAESDARSLGAALADYFSVASRTEYTGTGATGVDKVKFTDDNIVVLSATNTAVITKVADSNKYEIKITEGANRCPVDYMKASNRWDDTKYTYTYTI